MVQIAWGSKVHPEVLRKVIVICQEFGWSFDQASHLMACMAFESGESFLPSIKNVAGSGAVGLIQFMPNTAKGLKTSTELLSKMTVIEQLSYVRDYFKPYHHRIKNLSDMYMAILLPKYIGADEDAVLFTGGTIAYRQNSGLDANNDGLITKAEASAKVKAKLDKGMLPKNVGTL